MKPIRFIFKKEGGRGKLSRIYRFGFIAAALTSGKKKSQEAHLSEAIFPHFQYATIKTAGC